MPYDPIYSKGHVKSGLLPNIQLTVHVNQKWYVYFAIKRAFYTVYLFDYL